MPLLYSASLWPDIIGQSYVRTPLFNTIRTSYDTAGDQRRSLAGVMYHFDLGWTVLRDEEASQLLETTNYLAGQWGATLFYEWESRLNTYSIITPVGDLIGGGGGELGPGGFGGGPPTLTTYTLPATEITSLSVTVNGDALADDSYSYADEGPNGETVVTFLTSFAEFTVLTFTFTGRRQRNVMLESASISLADQATGASKWKANVSLMELP